MTTTERLDEMRAEALRRVDRAERDFKMLFVGAAIVEGLALAGFFLLMDFKDPLHRLLLVHAVLIYGTLAIGLVALGAYVRKNALRVLQAVEALGGQGGE